jgi:hypothetical protein
MFLEQVQTTEETAIAVSNVSNILFPVTMKSMWYDKPSQDGNGDISAGSPSAYSAVVRTDTNEELYAGKGYQIVENKSIVEAIDRNPDWRITKVINNNDRQFHINLRNDLIEPGVFSIGDKTFPYSPQITVRNSYDGSLSFSILAGIYIQVCGNGLIVANNAGSYKAKHTSSVLTPAEIEAQFVTIARSFGKIQAIINKKTWSTDQDITKRLFFDLIKGIPNHANNKPSPTSVTLQQRYFIEANHYGHGEFALMMAATNITTYPETYGISHSYWQTLVRNQSAFLN